MGWRVSQFWGRGRGGHARTVLGARTRAGGDRNTRMQARRPNAERRRSRSCSTGGVVEGVEGVVGRSGRSTRVRFRQVCGVEVDAVNGDGPSSGPTGDSTEQEARIHAHLLGHMGPDEHDPGEVEEVDVGGRQINGRLRSSPWPPSRCSRSVRFPPWYRSQSGSPFGIAFSVVPPSVSLSA